MKKRVVLFLLIGILLWGNVAARASKQTGICPHPLFGKTVLLDPGHGGVDSGAMGWRSGVREDTLNLAVAKELEALLCDAGVRILWTRRDENGLYKEDTPADRQKHEDMTNRAAIIRESGADYVISIHMNSYTSPDAFGAQTLYQTGNAEGQRLAGQIQEEFLGGIGSGNRRSAAGGDYMVLRNADCPAVLVECGFLSNPQEEEKLQTEAYQRQLAWHIYTGLMRFAAGGGSSLLGTEVGNAPTFCGMGLHRLPPTVSGGKVTLPT